MNSANNHPLLEVKDLEVTFTDDKGSLQALNQINFSVDREQFICVVGPSGSGKSTLIRVLAGLLVPTSGEVVLDGIPINEPRQGVGIVFQKANLMPWRSVLCNITLPLEINHVPQNEANERASELLSLIHI